MATLIDSCNEALAQIAAGQIVSLTEGTIEARECKRFAEPLLLEIADWAEWHFQKRRVTLAAVANDRPAEWLYAYARPTDMAEALAIREVEEAATSLPIAGPGDFPLQDAVPIPFLLENGVIYCNVESATLSYVSGSMDVSVLPPLVRRAFVLELAARICLPIKKDAKMAQFAAQQAEVARLRAIADEENKAPHRQTRYVSEAEWARAGYGV